VLSSPLSTRTQSTIVEKDDVITWEKRRLDTGKKNAIGHSGKLEVRELSACGDKDVQGALFLAFAKWTTGLSHLRLMLRG
jgi:hypothetical protein